ncbi:MAG: HD-GYP domain-containing protein [Candidatus Saccharibacteria bacterium]|nr:HD-GYP domain-containing protein [Candidatus Saccharibacteria bacterium]
MFQRYLAAFLIGICVILMIFLAITDSLSRKRKTIIFMMVFSSMMLLISEQLARTFDGDTSIIGFIVARTSKFLNYGINLTIVYIFTQYFKDMLKEEGGIKKVPKSIKAVEYILAVGGIFIVISQFTGLYYTYDAENVYHRSKFYWVSYLFSSITISILAINVIRYKKVLRKKLFVPFLMFTIAPMAMSIVHLIVRGKGSLIGATIVAMAVLLYCFSILDGNEVMRTAHQKKMEDLNQMIKETSSALAEAIDAKDTYTSGHSRRVAEYSAKIAKTYGKDDNYCREIYQIGLLHDIGKIGVPNAIINKKGKLTEEEYEIIKTHTVKGKEILSKISLSPNLPIGANYHHERYDGKGYPEGLKGEEIPEIARIIAVADTYDAMNSKRSYRDGLPKEKIRQELINGMGTQFDTRFAAVMVNLIEQGEV